jgi:hypothetical protein
MAANRSASRRNHFAVSGVTPHLTKTLNVEVVANQRSAGV